ASDGTDSDTQTFSFTVNPYPLTMTNPGDQSNTVYDQVNLPIQATDQSGGELNYQASNLPLGLSIDSATGEITGTIDHDDSGDSPYITTVSAQSTAPSGTYFASVTFTWTFAAAPLRL